MAKSVCALILIVSSLMFLLVNVQSCTLFFPPSPKSAAVDGTSAVDLGGQNYAYSRLNKRQAKIYYALKELAKKMGPGTYEIGNDSEENRRDLYIAHTALRNDRPDMFWIPGSYILITDNSSNFSADNSSRLSADNVPNLSADNSSRLSADNSSRLSADNSSRLSADNSSKLSAAYQTGNNGELTDLYNEKYNTPEKVSAIQQKIAEKLDGSFMPKLEPGADMSRYELELVIHGWLSDNVSYDKKAAAKISEDPDRAQEQYANALNIVGSILDGKAVCEGYARAFQYLCGIAGIESGIVSGITSGIAGIAGSSADGEPHMWNVVKIDGKWYHADATWNDIDGKPFHTYFNLDDENIAADHRAYEDISSVRTDDWELLPGQPYPSFNIMPVCDSLDDNYHIKAGTWIFVDEDIADRLAEIMIRSAEAGKGFLEVYVQAGIPDNIRLIAENAVTAANSALSSNNIGSYKITKLNTRGLLIEWE